MVALFLLQKVQLLVLLTLLLLKLHLLQFQLLLAKLILLSPNVCLLNSQFILLFKSKEEEEVMLVHLWLSSLSQNKFTKHTESLKPMFCMPNSSSG